MGFIIEWLPEPPPIFGLIQAHGRVSDAEMYRVFNMGVGFCVVAPPAAAAQVHAIARQHGVTAYQLGRAVADPQRRIWLQPRRLVSAGNAFVSGEPDPRAQAGRYSSRLRWGKGKHARSFRGYVPLRSPARAPALALIRHDLPRTTPSA
jgi:hypothetical protein